MEIQNESFNRVVNRIGFWSACFSAILAIMYISAEVVHLLGWLGTHDTSVSFFLRMTPSLLLAIAFVILMVSIHYYASHNKKIWSHIGLAFAVIYAGLVSIVYFVVLTVVTPYRMRGEAGQITVLAFEFGTFLYAIDVLGYGFMSLATLFAAPVFDGKHLKRWIRWALLVNGLIAPAIPMQMIYRPLWNVAALWGVTFPLSTVLLAVFFGRAEKSGQ